MATNGFKETKFKTIKLTEGDATFVETLCGPTYVRCTNTWS